MSISSQESTPEMPALQVEAGARSPWRFRRAWLLPAVVGLILVTSSLAWLRAQGPQPRFDQLVVSPANFVPSTSTAVANIVVNTPTLVTFTILIDTPTLNPTTVELQRVDAAGNLLTSVGRMFDNGQGGDSKPGDRTFTLAVSLSEPTTGRSYFRAAAAFRGNTQNAHSSVTPLDIDPFSLPPDPGEVGKQTVIGIDFDRNGVRDDVQRWIGLNFPSARMQAALQQIAAASQQSFLSSDASSALSAANAEIAASTCLNFVMGSAANAYDVGLQLDSQILNTPSRQAAYRASSRLVDIGLIEPLPRVADRRNSCLFNPDSLPK